MRVLISAPVSPPSLVPHHGHQPLSVLSLPPQGTQGVHHARPLPLQRCRCPVHILLLPAAAYQEDCVLGQMPGDGESDLVGRDGCDSFSPILTSSWDPDQMT